MNATDVSAPPRYLDHVMSAVLDDPHAWVWGLHRSGEVTFVSPHAAAALGRNSVVHGAGGGPDAFLGRMIEDLAPSPVVERMHRIVDQIARTGDPVVGRGVWAGRRLQSRFTPIADRDGQCSEMLVISRPAPLCSDLDAATPRVDHAHYAHLGDRLDCLTPRELEVLAYFGRGWSISDIAAHIVRAPKTIRRFQESLSRKLGVSGRCGLGLMARDLGLTPEHASLQRIRAVA